MPNSATTDSRTSWVIAKVAAVAISIAIFATVCGWFVAGKGSPLNHGVAPSVQDRPLLGVWVVANLPAATLFVNVFSKLGSETQYFLCVFMQWLVIGVPFGLLAVSLSKMRMLHEH